MQNSTRDEDVVARIGGDEFAIILSKSGFETAKSLSERIKYNIKEYNQKNKFSERLNISTGFAIKTKKNENIDNIFRQADEMMYNNKGREFVMSSE